MNLGRLLGYGERDQTEAILARHLDKDFTVFPMAETRDSIGRVERIGAKFGVKYPMDFVAHVCGHFPGIYVEVKEAIWPRPKLYDVGPFWSFLYALHTYSPSSQSEAWMRLDASTAEFQSTTKLKAAPILKIEGDADLFCTTSTGKIVQFRHESSEMEPVNLSFWELLEREVVSLRSRKDQKVAGAAAERGNGN